MKTFPSTLKMRGRGKKVGNGKKNMRREEKRIFSNVLRKIFFLIPFPISTLKNELKGRQKMCRDGKESIFEGDERWGRFFQEF